VTLFAARPENIKLELYSMTARFALESPHRPVVLPTSSIKYLGMRRQGQKLGSLARLEDYLLSGVQCYSLRGIVAVDRDERKRDGIDGARTIHPCNSTCMPSLSRARCRAALDQCLQQPSKAFQNPGAAHLGRLLREVLK